MNYVNYETSMFKYGVSDTFMSELSLLILDRKSLSQAKKILSKSHCVKSLTLKKIYVLASSIASSIMGEDLSLICPEMHNERVSMRSAAVANFKVKRQKRVINGASDVEDIMEEIEAAIFELGDLSL